MNHIDTSLITDMSALFEDLDIRNIQIDQWDVSNVTNMSSMFYGCREFTGQTKLSKWDTSKVTKMNSMFDSCKNFNGDLSGGDVSKVTNMAYMFLDCNIFEGNSLGKWDVSNVKNMLGMF